MRVIIILSHFYDGRICRSLEHAQVEIDFIVCYVMKVCRVSDKITMVFFR